MSNSTTARRVPKLMRVFAVIQWRRALSWLPRVQGQPWLLDHARDVVECPSWSQLGPEDAFSTLKYRTAQPTSC